MLPVRGVSLAPLLTERETSRTNEISSSRFCAERSAPRRRQVCYMENFTKRPPLTPLPSLLGNIFPRTCIFDSREDSMKTAITFQLRKLSRSFFLFPVLSLSLFAGSLEHGQQLLNERKFKEAEAELRQVVNNEPDNAAAKRCLGIALSHLGKNDESITHLRSAAVAEPDNPATLLALAESQIEAKQLSDAASSIKAASGKDPDAGELAYARGALAVNQKDFKPAVTWLEEAIAARPTNSMAHYYLGLAYSNQKRPDLMVHHFNEFLRLEPDNPNAAKVRSFLRVAR